MAKRVSAIRQAYQKEQKRINRALLKLRSQGYDITTVQLPPEPKRVTKKALEELQDITPKKLRLQVQQTGYVPPKGTPLRTQGHFTTQLEAIQRAHRIELQRIDKLAREAELEAQRNREATERFIREQNDNNRWSNEPETVVADDGFVDTYVETATDYDYYNNITDEDRAEFQYEDISETKPVETYPEIVDNEIVYRDVVTGEEVDRAPLSIDTTDEKIIYMDAYTGEIIKEEPNVWGYQGYDATELALDNLRSILGAYPASIANHFGSLLDRMVDTYGANTVGNAIQEMELKNGQSVLESLQSAPDAYEEINQTFSELVEYLPFTDKEKEELRVEFSLHEPYQEVT